MTKYAQSQNAKRRLLDPEKFKITIDGKPVELYTLSNKNGLVVQLTNYGARVVAFWVPDKKGDFADVVLGYPSIEEYLLQKNYFGATIGRYANRIAKGRFELNGKVHDLVQNNGDNHLHGGEKGFESVLWEIAEFNKNYMVLTYTSSHGEENYPGNLSVTITYTLTDDNELKIEYAATTDQVTIVNLTHHSFFNLKGEGEGDILNHLLWINADKYTPIIQGSIPSGEIKSLKNTSLDFREISKVGERIEDESEQLTIGQGYDHNYVLNNKNGDLAHAAKVVEPISGRIMDVFTNEPGLQFYSGNFLNGTNVGKSDKRYLRRGAICLEAQHFPDSPNQANFPSVRLLPGEKYQSVCIYQFSTK